MSGIMTSWGNAPLLQTDTSSWRTQPWRVGMWKFSNVLSISITSAAWRRIETSSKTCRSPTWPSHNKRHDWFNPWQMPRMILDTMGKAGSPTSTWCSWSTICIMEALVVSAEFNQRRFKREENHLKESLKTWKVELMVTAHKLHMDSRCFPLII